MPDLRSIVPRRPPASIGGDGDSYSLGYSASVRSSRRPAVTFTSTGSNEPSVRTCGASSTHALSCGKASRQFSLSPASSRRHVPRMCPQEAEAAFAYSGYAGLAASKNTVKRPQSTWKKSAASIVAACAHGKFRHVVSVRR